MPPSSYGTSSRPTSGNSESAELETPSPTHGHAPLAYNNHIDTIHLARLANTLSILPVALCLCVKEPDVLVDRQQREDGTLMVLDKADVKRYIEGYGKLWQLSEHMLQRIFFAPPSKSHKNPAECKHAMECMQKRLSDEKSPNHLANWGPDIEGEFGGCAACSETVTERKHAERCEL